MAIRSCMRALAMMATAGTLLVSHTARGENAVLAGALRVEPPTLVCLGFQWAIQGDDNRNARVRLQYRRAGEDSWREGLPPLRIGKEAAGTPEWNYITPLLFAGSLFDLEPDTTYECRLELNDPDGVSGPSIHQVTLRTRAEPRPAAGGRVRHVYPPGWHGEKIEPAYEGLLHAYYGYRRYADWVLTTDPVRPGDTIVVHAGVYRADYKDYRDPLGVTFDGTYALTVDGTEQAPIAIVAAGDGDVVFDGNGTARLFDVTTADWTYFEGLTFRNTETAICAGTMNIIGCQGLAVRHCLFEDVGIGIQGQFEGSRHFYIADNRFIGREDRDAVYHHRLEEGRNVQRIASYYAVKLHGQGHTVAYNTVRYFFDGIDICTHATPEPDPELRASAIDVYNNDLYLCNDNFIEADGGHHNIRLLRNRCFNSGQQALSNQPVLGGPVYWIRNLVYNCGNATTFKSWGMFPAGIVALHNTSSGVFARADKPASNVYSRNNLFLPSDDASLPTLGLSTPTSYSSLDYNGYRKRTPFIAFRGQASPGSSDAGAATFDSLAAFAESTGHERHGREVDYDIFVDASPPRFASFREEHRARGEAYPLYDPEDYDFRLRPGAVAIDAGTPLPNINDAFTGSAPDLGAYEFGKPPPHYGPRPR